jgi:hypothetical protein
LIFGGGEVLFYRGAVETCAEVPCALLFAGEEVLSLETGAMVARVTTRDWVRFIVFLSPVVDACRFGSFLICMPRFCEGGALRSFVDGSTFA